jgi:hypothetical protein
MISLGGLCVLLWMSSASGKHNDTSLWVFFGCRVKWQHRGHSAQTPKSGQ